MSDVSVMYEALVLGVCQRYGIYDPVLGRVPMQADVEAAAEIGGPGWPGDGYAQQGRSANHDLMRSVGWALAFGDWRPYLEICKFLDDPRVGVGSNEPMSPLYRSGWSMGPHCVSERFGTPDVQRQARRHLRRYAAMAGLSTWRGPLGRVRVERQDGNVEWRPMRELRYSQVSAAGRGLMSAGITWWPYQMAVPLMEYLLDEMPENPQTWDAVPGHPTYGRTVAWPIWVLRELAARGSCDALSEDEQRRLKSWITNRADPQILLDLAADAPCGPTGYGWAQRKDGSEVTWLNRDASGTKPAAMICERFTDNTAVQYSPVPWVSDKHHRAEAGVSEGVVWTRDTTTGYEQRVELGDVRQMMTWDANGLRVVEGEVPEPVPPPKPEPDCESKLEKAIRLSERAGKNARAALHELQFGGQRYEARRHVGRIIDRCNEIRALGEDGDDE